MNNKAPGSSLPSPDHAAAMDANRPTLTDRDWTQIEEAARGCVSGTSDEWPHLVAAIEKLTGKPLDGRKCSSWLQGFCEGVLIQRGRGNFSA